MKKALALLLLGGAWFGTSIFAAESITASQIIEKIKAHTGKPWTVPTVDTFKAGNPDTPVTGIVTTFSATFDVLERAAAQGKNFVIAHEPTYYNHLDETDWLKSDPVYQQKLAFIQAHHMVVFRFHDHWHSMAPDGIRHGMAAALGWQQYQDAQNPFRFVLPQTTLASLAAQIKERLHIRTLRVVGDPKLRVSEIGFLPGAAGEQRQVQLLERNDIQVLVAGESREWETVEYAWDAQKEHRPKALILMGHDVSEEEGMRYCAEWLKTFLNVPIEYIPAGEPFWTPSAGQP
ncbi:MAG TPA: Nif3-like dinuclear metal center hexameric protein [Bryobacteraceae bacterium]|nr:Nif3-like dinuclear metal center hexameric protein [Bryobacteraceae bacterium]